MNYSNIDKENKEHILKIIDILYNECLSAGGDGDALWYSRYFDIKDIFILIEEYNKKTKFPWEINVKNDTIHWGIGQEWVIITNNEEIYNHSSTWIQMKIRF